jgi:Lon protease-like protein
LTKPTLQTKSENLSRLIVALFLYQHGINSAEMHLIGTAATVQEIKSQSLPTPMYILLVAGCCRFRVTDVEQEVPFPVAIVEQLGKFAFESQ